MTRAPRRAVVAGFTVVAILIALLVYNVVQLHRGWDQIGPLRAGGRAPDFSLPSVGGAPLRLSAQRAPLLLLDFWAAWCGPCMRSMPTLAMLQRELAPRGLQVVSINVDGNAEAARRISGTLGAAVPVLLDDGTVSQAYGVHTLPFVVLLRPDRKVVDVFSGSVPEARLRAALHRALAPR